ncbi:MAG TPA: hypothetical protein VMB81_15340 [Candidatus Sulfotelmatobacter sp.]|nr:hypothetical protein [Candidatus Sulfotelmatobacter sp.]
MLAGLALLLPSATDLVGLARMLATCLVLWGCGRWVAREAAPEIQLTAGWGAACSALTLWGAVLPIALTWPGIAVVVVGAAGLALRRPQRGEWLAVGRVVAVAAPVLLLLAGTRPVLIDSFTHWLPNAAYLVAHASFPADDRAPGFGFFPAFPYNLQLVAFLAALGLDRLPPGAMIHANLVLQLAPTLLLARLLARLEAVPHAAPGWAAIAGGLLACWWLNPGFGPEIAFSDYGDVATGVALAMAGWLALRVVLGHDRRPVALAFTLAALIDVKQADLVLVVAVVGSAGGLALLRRDRSAVVRLTTALLPALVLYAVWRLYVTTHLTGGENELMPIARWRIAALPTILARIADVWLQKITFFGILAAALAIGALRWRRGRRDEATTLLMLLAGSAAIYNAFLVFAYIAHFRGVMSDNAQSYYRLNTELALFLMIGLVLLVREDWVVRRLGAGRWRRVVPAVAVIAALALPVGFFERVRFDLRRARGVPWALAEAVAPALDKTDRLAILNTGAHDGALGLRAYLGLLAPGVAAEALRFDPISVVPNLPARGFDRLLATCAAAVDDSLPRDSAALFAWDGARWQPRLVVPLALRPGQLFGEQHSGELFGCG